MNDHAARIERLRQWTAQEREEVDATWNVEGKEYHKIMDELNAAIDAYEQAPGKDDAITQLRAALADLMEQARRVLAETAPEGADDADRARTQCALREMRACYNDDELDQYSSALDAAIAAYERESAKDEAIAQLRAALEQLLEADTGHVNDYHDALNEARRVLGETAP